MPATALVMNMFHTGLGIARSLGERGIPVIGLTSKRVFGNYTRYAKVERMPDSREQPELLLDALLGLSLDLDGPAVIFPTRDDDLVFLNRFRLELAPRFSMVVPSARALDACLNKWETAALAQRVGISVPACWAVEKAADLWRVLDEVTYPSVLKPLCSHFWRKGENWKVVRARKAVVVHSQQELLSEYEAISHADERVLLQEVIPGKDDRLFITACYLDRHSKWVAGFNAQKLFQVPESFGTGCIVQSVDRPELFEPTARLLQEMKFSGIAEVEYKWDERASAFKLIEINARPWDQHRLGTLCGIDLMYLAYCEHAGLPQPKFGAPVPGHKWIAEDTLLTTAIQLAGHQDPRLRMLFRQARGQRVYAIWCRKDPLPFILYSLTEFLPSLLRSCIRALWSFLKRVGSTTLGRRKRGLTYESH